MQGTNNNHGLRDSLIDRLIAPSNFDDALLDADLREDDISVLEDIENVVDELFSLYKDESIKVFLVNLDNIMGVLQNYYEDFAVIWENITTNPDLYKVIVKTFRQLIADTSVFTAADKEMAHFITMETDLKTIENYFFSDSFHPELQYGEKIEEVMTLVYNYELMLKEDPILNSSFFYNYYKGSYVLIELRNSIYLNLQLLKIALMRHGYYGEL
ncbi:MAG: hypothetical protein Q9M91_06030 [Candidatus Dojkabacteria bacterium]|nr:hypothetical protein [Candidatus Dojkabacteria bacterium]MDQ7021358.1 hypothetical protein [Candidatus Dojkabacteria bacterium]